MSKGDGWIDYVFVNPVTQALEPKSAYGKKVSDTVWLGVGIYLK